MVAGGNEAINLYLNYSKKTFTIHENRVFFEEVVPGLKWRGNKGQGHCPLSSHGGPDRNASFCVDAEKGVWYCHAEALGGGMVALAKKTGVDLPGWQK